MVEKPDYVTNFVRPVNTEIKYIRGHWYLYERSNVYDPQLGRSRKKSGKILGSITEQGLIPSKTRRGRVNPVLNDVVEVGAVNYIYQRTEWMRSRLQMHFPDLWEHIYVAAVIRAIYDCRFRRLQLHYEDSVLSYIYPGLSFMPNAITEFLNTLGRMRGAIRSYMQEMVAEHERFLLFDGHRLLSASHTIDNAECGYDSKMRYKPQINLLYMFTLGGDMGYPVYYKQYLGSTLDVSAFSDMLKESTAYADSCTVIADKGFASDDGFTLLEECGLNYVIPLKRGNRFVKGRVPASPFGYEEAFSFNGRGIHSLTIGESKNISYKDLTQTLLKIKAGKIEGKWVVYPIKKSVQRLCEKMRFNPSDLTELNLQGGQ